MINFLIKGPLIYKAIFISGLIKVQLLRTPLIFLFLKYICTYATCMVSKLNRLHTLSIEGANALDSVFVSSVSVLDWRWPLTQSAVYALWVYSCTPLARAGTLVPPPERARRMLYSCYTNKLKLLSHPYSVKCYILKNI